MVPHPEAARSPVLLEQLVLVGPLALLALRTEAVPGLLVRQALLGQQGLVAQLAQQEQQGLLGPRPVERSRHR